MAQSQCLPSHSPYKDKIDSFFTPSATQIEEINAFLVKARSQFSGLEREIADLDSQIAPLRAQRDALGVVISAHKSLLAPIRRVPDDILREIFLDCLPTDENPLVDPSQPPLLFGQVNRHWRALSHATPLLWSRLRLGALRYRFEDSKALAKPIASPDAHTASQLQCTVSNWIKHSSQTRLSISYSENDFFYFDPAEPALREVLRAALIAPERIECLELRGESTLLADALSLEGSRMPSLRLLSLNLRQQPFRGFDEAPIFAGPPPALRSLFLMGRGVPRDIPAPWGQLTELGLSIGSSEETFEGGMDISAACEILASAPKLVRCHCQICPRRPGGTLPPGRSRQPPAPLPNLQELSVSFPEGLGFEHEPEQFFSSIDAPNLRFLKITFTYFRLPDRAAEVLAPNLVPDDDDLVVLIDPMISASYLLTILRVLPPHTTHLFVAERPGIGKATHGIELPPNFFGTWIEEDICLHLRHLELQTATSEFGHTGLLDFLASRVPRLRSLGLDVPSIQGVDIKDQLNDMDQLRVTYMEPPPKPSWNFAHSQPEREPEPYH
ncbi:hypothetical protein HMN09_00984300 [Mycena chlorophos]|uniref:F-box domain-containing protein n=1 Tax=Mycena chlorophos TaxID=658473 RepID=A0A8H6SIV3_MYCCL|nr:hypothetical protein HMN09_00984300 [Mycena chlorophos]